MIPEVKVSGGLFMQAPVDFDQKTDTWKSVYYGCTKSCVHSGYVETQPRPVSEGEAISQLAGFTLHLPLLRCGMALAETTKGALAAPGPSHLLISMQFALLIFKSATASSFSK